MLPGVLFGVREVPQASTGRHPRGLLDVAREAWEQHWERHSACTANEDSHRFMPLVREYLAEAQCAQCCLYDRPAQPREFLPGNRVLIL